MSAEIKLIQKAKNYQDYLDSKVKVSPDCIVETSNTYIEIPKALWQLGKDTNFKNAGAQIGEMLFNNLKKRFG